MNTYYFDVIRTLSIETAECTDMSAQLVNGSSSLNGRLEVCFRGRWGTVCDDQFGSNSAMVACRQLDLSKPSAASF